MNSSYSRPCEGSLYCNLQVPLRARMDPLAVNMVDVVTLEAQDCVRRGECPRRLTGPGFVKVLRAFGREESVRLSRDPSTLGQLMVAQTQAVKQWVEDDRNELRIYVARDPRRESLQTQESAEPASQ